MKTMLKVASAAGLLGLAAASSSALAAPLPYLTYQQYAGWTDVGSTFDPGGTGWTGLEFNDPTGASYPSNTYTNIAWYGTTTGADPSFIDIYSHDTSTGGAGLSTPGQWQEGEWAIITTLTQTNNPLTSNTTNMPNPLWTVDAVANLHIGDNNGAHLHSDLNNITSIEFWETNNALSGSSCMSPAPFETVCDDIFKVTALDFAPISFTHDGHLYTIDFTLIPGAVTDDAVETGETTIVCAFDDPACAAYGIPEGEIWVFTPEYRPGTSTIYVAMSYSVTAVPEPSIVALFALGMLGVGFAARRRKEDTVA